MAGLEEVWGTQAGLLLVTQAVAYTKGKSVQARRLSSGNVLWEADDLDPGIEYGAGVVAASADRVVIRTSQIHGYSGSAAQPESLRGLDAATGEELWRRPFRAGTRPVAVRDVIVCVSEADNLVAVSPRDGSPLWQHFVGEAHVVVAAHGDVFAFAPSPDRIMVIDADGITLWQHQHEDDHRGFPRWAGDGLLVTGKTVGAAYDVAGNELARYKCDRPTPIGWISGDTCFVLVSREVVAVHGTDVLWRSPVPGAEARPSLGAAGELRCDHEICVATNSYGVFAMSKADGRVLWSTEMPEGADRIIFDGDRVLTNGLSGLRVHDRASGVVVASWLIEDPQHGCWPPVPVDDGHILVSFANGATRLLALTT